MLPPGLALLSVSDRAWKVIGENHTPAYYLNLLSYREWAAKGMTPNTPAISLIMGLSAVCDLIDEEGGFSKTVERHTLMKNMVREAMKALSIELLTDDEYASPTITAIKKPEGLELSTFLGHLKKTIILILPVKLDLYKGKFSDLGIWAIASLVIFLKLFP